MGQMDDMIAAARAGYGLRGEDLARACVPYVDEAVKATAEAGTTPDGTPWEPRKDGGRALANAAAALSTRAVGDVVQVTLRAPEAIHNFGTGHVPRRQILPDGGAGIPQNVADALDRACTEGFRRALGEA